MSKKENLSPKETINVQKLPPSVVPKVLQTTRMKKVLQNLNQTVQNNERNSNGKKISSNSPSPHKSESLEKNSKILHSSTKITTNLNNKTKSMATSSTKNILPTTSSIATRKIVPLSAKYTSTTKNILESTKCIPSAGKVQLSSTLKNEQNQQSLSKKLAASSPSSTNQIKPSNTVSSLRRSAINITKSQLYETNSNIKNTNVRSVNEKSSISSQSSEKARLNQPILRSTIAGTSRITPILKKTSFESTKKNPLVDSIALNQCCSGNVTKKTIIDKDDNKKVNTEIKIENKIRPLANSTSSTTLSNINIVKNTVTTEKNTSSLLSKKNENTVRAQENISKSKISSTTTSKFRSKSPKKANNYPRKSDDSSQLSIHFHISTNNTKSETLTTNLTKSSFNAPLNRPKLPTPKISNSLLSKKSMKSSNNSQNANINFPQSTSERTKPLMKRADSCSTASRPALIKTGSLSKPGFR